MPPAKLAEIQSQGSGVGIRGMRERLRQFQGTMIVESDSSGTRVQVTIPIPKAASPSGSGAEPVKALA
jgi:signal transduction histidine kinase